MNNLFDSNKLFEKDGLTFDCSEDKISLYGNFDITKDSVGLQKVSDLLLTLTSVRNTLLTLDSKGSLPAKEQMIKSVIKKNPFGND